MWWSHYDLGTGSSECRRHGRDDLIAWNVFSCDQAALWMSQSVRLFVCPPVIHFSHHRIIMKCLEVITNDRSDVHAKGQGQRLNVKVTEVKTQRSGFRTVTSVWIDIWWWNDAQSLMLLRRGALLFFRVIRQILRSHGEKTSILTQIWRFRTVTPVWINPWLKIMLKAWSSIEEVPYCFSRSSVKFQGQTGQKIADFDPNWTFPDCNFSLYWHMAMKWCTKLDVAKERCPVVFQGHPSNSEVTRLKNRWFWPKLCVSGL